MAEAVYILCALTSAACAVLLLRGWARTRVRLLLWSGLCFACLFLNNSLLFIDKAIIPSHDLSVLRQIAAVCGLLILLYGLVWEAEA